MNKLKLFIYLLFIIFIFSSCNVRIDRRNHESANTKVKSTQNIDVTYRSIEASYRIYNNANELTTTATHVLSGKVTNISFQILDISTGQLPTETSEEDNCYLHTICTVDISASYKGDAKKSISIRLGGGLRDYLVAQQLAVLGEDAKNGIPIWENSPDIIVGGTYLFILYKFPQQEFALCDPLLINLTQSLYSLHDPFEKHSSRGPDLEEPQKHYSEITDEDGNPLISAKDIIESFGEDKWDTFWTKWQKDNPKWETRLDKAAVEKVLSE